MINLRMMVRLSCTLFLLFMLNVAYAVETHTKLWTSALFTGPVSKGSRIKYYLEPDLRFIDSKYKFSQGLIWAALGYQVGPRLTFFVGDATLTSRNVSGVYDHHNVPWQQMNLMVTNIMSSYLLSRTRLEEIKSMHESQWAIVLRERLVLKIPFGTWAGHPQTLALSEEVFFNVKHPEWTGSNRFIEQNRVYIGIHTLLTKYTSFGVGYMNQYLFANTDQMSNILVVEVQVNTG